MLRSTATDDWYFIRQAQNHDHITANIHNSRNFQTKQKHSTSVPPATYSGMINYRQPQSFHSQVILSVLQYRIDYILTPDIPMQHMYRVLWVITRLESDVLQPAMVRNRLPARQRLEKFNYDGAFTFDNKTENSPQQNSSICKTFPTNNTFKHHLKTLSFFTQHLLPTHLWPQTVYMTNSSIIITIINQLLSQVRTKSCYLSITGISTWSTQCPKVCRSMHKKLTN